MKHFVYAARTRRLTPGYLFKRYAAGLLSITFSSPPISLSSTAACRRSGLHRLAEGINCFWLIKAPNFHPINSKPGATLKRAIDGCLKHWLCLAPFSGARTGVCTGVYTSLNPATVIADVFTAITFRPCATTGASMFCLIA